MTAANGTINQIGRPEAINPKKTSVNESSREKESEVYEFVPQYTPSFTLHQTQPSRNGQVPTLHFPIPNKSEAISKNLTTDSTRISSNSLSVPGLSLEKVGGFSQKAMKSSHSIASNSGVILHPQFHLFCKHFSKILNCMFELDAKKTDLLSHKSFNVEAVFLRIINQENNCPELRKNRSFNFEAFRGFLKEIGIQGGMIKSVIDLFSSFDYQHQCSLGFSE